MSVDPWSHDNKEWQRTLDLARDAGYPAPTVVTSHGGLVLKCPAGDPRHGERVYSTAKGTESVARTTRSKIRACDHRDLQTPIGKVNTALHSAERWISAAERQQALLGVESQLDELMTSIETAEEVLDDAELSFEALAAEHTALEAAQAEDSVELGFDPSTTTSRQMAGKASSQLREARLVMRDQLPKPTKAGDEIRVLAQRLAQLRSRLNLLRT